MSPTRARWRLYVFLVFLRIFIGFTSLSVIHPDEHFQNPEIAVGIVFNYSQSGGVPFRTWEWMGTEPARSIAPLVVSSQAAFSVVRAMFGNSKLVSHCTYEAATDE
jgi:phosphatidylinositol glycan class Z